MSEAQMQANKIVDKSKQAFCIELFIRQYPDRDYEMIYDGVNASGEACIPLTSVVGRLSELTKANKIYISGTHKVGNRSRSLYRAMTDEKLIELKRGQGEIF